jgi:hypothetical protein
MRPKVTERRQPPERFGMKEGTTVTALLHAPEHHASGNARQHANA